MRTSDDAQSIWHNSDTPGWVSRSFTRMTNVNGTGVRETPILVGEGKPDCAPGPLFDECVLPITGARNQTRNPLESQSIFFLEARKGKTI